MSTGENGSKSRGTGRTEFCQCLSGDESSLNLKLAFDGASAPPSYSVVFIRDHAHTETGTMRKMLFQILG
eukprot:6227001-Amphidinium_carterae.2